jgi:hypothetical protein
MPWVGDLVEIRETPKTAIEPAKTACV